MIVIVDTNIVFSGILNPEGTVSGLLLNSSDNFEFFAPTAMIWGLEKHHEKLLKISRYSEKDLNFLRRILLKKNRNNPPRIRSGLHLGEDNGIGKGGRRIRHPVHCVKLGVGPVFGQVINS